MTPMFVPLFYIPMAVATLPGEVRMYARIMNRGWPNVSELVFWFLKVSTARWRVPCQLRY